MKYLDNLAILTVKGPFNIHECMAGIRKKGHYGKGLSISRLKLVMFSTWHNSFDLCRKFWILKCLLGYFFGRDGSVFLIVNFNPSELFVRINVF